MKTRMILVMFTSVAVITLSMPGYAADFSDGIQMSANEELEASELFKSEENTNIFIDEPIEVETIQTLDTDMQIGTEGLEYEYIELIDAYRVAKGVNKKEVTVPKNYNGKKVREIGENAFKGCDKLETIFLPGYYENPAFTIKESAFEDCIYLQDVQAGHTITIESNAFKNCPRLTLLGTLTKGISSIADDAFDADSRVIVFEAGALPYREDDYPFYHLYMEEGEDLGYEYGVDCLEVYDKVAQKNDGWKIVNCLYDKEAIQILGRGGAVTGVGRKAFYGADKLKAVDLGDSVKFIETKAFGECTSLEKLYIPATTKEIAEDAFYGCDSLTIYTEKGSYAAKFAKAHHIPVSYKTTQDVMKNTEMKLKVNRKSTNSDILDLTWEKVSFADGYQIQAKEGKDGKYKTIERIKNGDISTYQTDVTRYEKRDVTYRIRAYSMGEDGKAIYTPYKSVKVTLWPKQPKLISTVKRSKGKITLKWEKTANTNGYCIYRTTDWKHFTRIKTIKNKNTVTYTDTGLKKGITYGYAIRSYRIDSNGKRLYSTKYCYTGVEY